MSIVGFESAAAFVALAALLEEVGCFSMVLEGIPWQLGERITDSVSIPTIGIGAGPRCDGQVLVVNDMLGIMEDFSPRFVKRYGEVGKTMAKAFAEYVSDVKEGRFPTDEHSYS